MKIFLNAECFDSVGGWTIDTQSYETEGFCYLLAHGAGKAVADAESSFTIPQRGTFKVWVRTRNWTAVWGRGTPAGRFRVKIDGAALPCELGTVSANWAWQEAGIRELEAGTHTVALHDLTGFDGRCDAVLLTDELEFQVPEEKEALAQFRRECCRTVIEDDPEEYDLLICGGGFAGLCAGVAAKAQKLRFKVIHDRAVAGGCGSSEVRVWVGGDTHTGIYPNLGNPATMLSPIAGRPGMKKYKELFEDDRKTALFEKGKELLLSEIVTHVEMDPASPGRIAAVITRSVRTGRETRRRARLFADCTGDALLARKANCRTMYGSESRSEFNESLGRPQKSRQVMGHSTLWETEDRGRKVMFPDIDWGIEFNEENCLARLNCCWDWETGQYRDQVGEIEYIRDYGIMSCYANWSFLKNRSERKKEWENLDLDWLSAIGGKRESYRVVGDLILTQNDIQQDVIYPDGTASTTWSIDLHMPDPDNEAKFAEPFQSCAYHVGLERPYAVPYRCLYAADCSNLFLGGRCLSATHVAFSSIRVMRTLGMLGEVIAMAAAVCTAHGCDPRAVYTDHLEELQALMKEGTPMRLPCAWGTAFHEAYHFMRPVGSAGNPDNENCWIRFDREGVAFTPVDPALGDAIEKLDVIHHNGKPFRK